MKKNCYRRTDGRWQYSRQQNGLRYYAIASTYRELLEKIKDIKPKVLKTVKHKTTKTSQNTFLQYCSFYIDNYVKNKKISKDSLKDWQRQLEKDITPAFKYIKLSDITSEHIQNFIDGITKERKRETLYQRLVKILKKAYATGKIKRDITLGVEKPKRENKEERNPLTFHEQIQLLKAVKNTKLFAFTIFSLVVGSRREESLKFNIKEDLDEKRLQIHIRGTKTANADRFVPITREFAEFLKANITETFNLSKYYVTHELGNIFRAIKVKGCLHSLRHTCSANLYFLGARDKYRQMQLGHASMMTTNDIYTNIKENITNRRLRLIYGDLYPHFD